MVSQEKLDALRKKIRKERTIRESHADFKQRQLERRLEAKKIKKELFKLKHGRKVAIAKKISKPVGRGIITTGKAVFYGLEQVTRPPKPQKKRRKRK